MSNPAVVKSASVTIQGRPFYLDDNYGESVHIHFGDIRLDFTLARLDAFIAQLDEVLRDECFRACGAGAPGGAGRAALKSALLSKAYALKKRVDAGRGAAANAREVDEAVRAMIESR